MRKTIIFLLATTLTGCASPKITNIREREITSPLPVEADRLVIQGDVFEPRSIIVKAGSPIFIENKDPRLYTIVSDPHPTHDQIKELYLPIYKDQSKELKLDKKGRFGIHLEENPSVRAEIMVI